jgi:hypothetical protein
LGWDCGIDKKAREIVEVTAQKYVEPETLSSSIQIGILVFLLALALGSPYHKVVEEKEVVARFGSNTRITWPGLRSSFLDFSETALVPGCFPQAPCMMLIGFNCS